MDRRSFLASLAATMFPLPAVAGGGGQLAALRAALADPFYQHVGIAFIGDSITWGRALPENAAPSGTKTWTLVDGRDDFTADSFVNLFKRYIGENWFPGSSATISNWPTSTSGESTVRYGKSLLLFPYAPMAPITNGGAVSAGEVAHASAKLGAQFVISDANTAGTSSVVLTIPNFTGWNIGLYYTAAPDGCDYELVVDGDVVGTFPTYASETTHQQYRNHPFAFVHNKTVEIRLKRSGASPSIQRVRLEAVEIKKRANIVNQGGNGWTAYTWLTNVFAAEQMPWYPEDTFTFIMLGTNDRGVYSNRPSGLMTFRKDLNALIDHCEAQTQVILMTPNPAADEATADIAFTMLEAREVIMDIGRRRSIDVVDNFSIFAGTEGYLADLIHPNAVGHDVIFNNIKAHLA